MKVVAGLSCFHETLFLDYSIQSIYDFVDEIILTDRAMESAVHAGFDETSPDSVRQVIDKWVDNKKVFLTENKGAPPKTFGQLLTPSFELAKAREADWYFNVGADEIWPKSCLKILKPFLQKCDKQGIMGLNVWMWHFAPDFWHYKDFRNPRLAKMTEKACLCEAGDAVIWPDKKLYQLAGDCETLYRPGTPQHIIDINSDFPKNLRAFHYSCVGEERINFKVKFWKRHNGSFGDRYNKAYVEKDWEAFKRFGFINFTGTHPDVMNDHPLYNQRLY